MGWAVGIAVASSLLTEKDAALGQCGQAVLWAMAEGMHSACAKLAKFEQRQGFSEPSEVHKQSCSTQWHYLHKRLLRYLCSWIHKRCEGSTTP